MSLISQNPATEEVLAKYEELENSQIEKALELTSDVQKEWKLTSFEERKSLFLKLADLMRTKRGYLRELITLEMGMPVSQSDSEIEKVSQLAEYYGENGERFLKNDYVDTDSKESYVAYEPLGTLLHIAPWNFPIYLALRPVIPAIMAGNTALLKHSSNVPQCAGVIQALFEEAGFPKGVFQTLMIGSSKVEPVVRDKRVHFVSVIGSERAGTSVARTAGEEIKKTLLELGGSDPFIVLKDADFGKVFPSACSSRFRNCGQSCNAAKRFIVHEDIFDEFVEKYKQNVVEGEVFGDPLDSKTTFGPVATEKALREIEKVVEDSVKQGAKVVLGGHGDFLKSFPAWDEFKKRHSKGYYYPPTILTNIKQSMPVAHKEIFGPVAPIISATTTEEAIQMANESDYGLGSSIWTEDYDLAKRLIPQIEAGNVFVNSMVRSNIKMPYGGIKKSGYGREMGEHGIKEFVNVKTVIIK
jgi:succinate-semialdehyde dehydrogenase/glutarate-semialdehyde dehydrogenase